MGPLNPPRPELIVGLLCFVAVFVIFAKVLIPRIEKILKAREEAIDGTVERAVAINDEARRIHDEYQAELSAARHKVAQVRQAAAEEGASLLAALRAEGQKERDDSVASAKAQLEADRIIVEAELREAMFNLATELAGRIVGEPLDDSPTARAMADDFFAALEAGDSVRS
ncbi:hypothetical protein [Streptomyces sp. NPDC020362]|uniref:F0F1 ATP synthase subunit B family protein n=1 Tax=unclassified Streptomyces TaxID=2593676 RepID=UPI0033FF0169